MKLITSSTYFYVLNIQSWFNKYIAIYRYIHISKESYYIKYDTVFQNTATKLKKYVLYSKPIYSSSVAYQSYNYIL